jgi:23S rRNA (cytidine1920-2'-O)/16S rRNA (cytidine1409-2'-O)-methyltransferase
MCDLYVSAITDTRACRAPPQTVGYPLGKYGISSGQSAVKNLCRGAESGGRADRRYGCRVKKERIDAVLAQRGLFPSRTAAAGAVRAGSVRVGRDGPIALRPSQLVEPEASLIVDEGPRYVSRGGVKLENALSVLGIDVAGRDCLDVGASTGGFTDCLLQRGAARVAAVDVAYGQLDLGLREDSRVVAIERLNARGLELTDLPFGPELATIDVSFISLAKVLPAVVGCLTVGGEVLAMVKPQFELGRERVGRGVVRNLADRREAILSVAEVARELGLPIRGFASSGLPGPKGNRETFIWCGGDGAEVGDLAAAIAEAEPGP